MRLDELELRRPRAKAEWRAVCAERCTYGSGRRSAIALLNLLKLKGEWLYLYRAIDSNGNTVEFLFSRNRDLKAAKRFMHKAPAQHGRPEKITIDGSRANRTAIMQCDSENRLRQGRKPIAISSSKYTDNDIEPDLRRVERRIQCMLGFKSEAAASITLARIELVHMMRKLQGNFGSTAPLSHQQQFTALAA